MIVLHALPITVIHWRDAKTHLLSARMTVMPALTMLASMGLVLTHLFRIVVNRQQSAMTPMHAPRILVPTISALIQ